MFFFKKSFFIFYFILIILCLYFVKNIRIDASSDSLVLQNDENFQFFEYYNEIFINKNFLVLAVESKKEINNYNDIEF